MQIRAAVFRTPDAGPVIEDVELSGPGPGEVLVRMVATGVCHTDLKSAAAGSRVPFPVVLGHEGAGIVAAVGPGVTKVAEGDPVVMTFGSCGHCPSCLDAEPAYCHNTRNFACTRPDGSHYLSADGAPVHGDFFNQSSFATHAIGDQSGVVKVRDDAPLELLGPLGCGIQTGAGAVLNVLKLRPGQSLAIFGTGSLGLSAVMAARIAGAGRIVAVDRLAARLEMAREFGAHDTILAGNDPVAPEIMRLLPGGVDLSLDTTGALAVMQQAIDVLAPRGTCAFVAGPWDGSALPLSVRHLIPGRTITGIMEGNSNPDLFIPMLIDFHMQGRFPFDRLMRFYPFEAIAEAFHDSEAGTTVKPILRFE